MDGFQRRRLEITKKNSNKNLRGIPMTNGGNDGAQWSPWVPLRHVIYGALYVCACVVSVEVFNPGGYCYDQQDSFLVKNRNSLCIY